MSPTTTLFSRAKSFLPIFKESGDYYERLEVSEIEGDMLKALVDNDSKSLMAKFGKLIKARSILAQEELKSLKETKP